MSRRFFAATVWLSEKEWEEIKSARALQARGTTSEEIRSRMGMTPEPYGFQKYLKAQREIEEMWDE